MQYTSGDVVGLDAFRAHVTNLFKVCNVACFASAAQLRWLYVPQNTRACLSYNAVFPTLISIDAIENRAIVKWGFDGELRSHDVACIHLLTPRAAVNRRPVVLLLLQMLHDQGNRVQ